MSDVAQFIQAVTARSGKPWFRITNAAGGDARKAKINIFAPIGTAFWSKAVAAVDFVEALDALDVDELEVHINSPGGSLFDGMAIYNALRQHSATVTTVVDGVAASAASIIAMAGDEVIMSPGSHMMIHDASGICLGQAKDMAKTGEILDKLSQSIAAQYQKRAGGKVDDWRAAMLEETWYTDQEAVDAHLADKVADTKSTGDEETVDPATEDDTFDDARDLTRFFADAPDLAVAALATTKPPTASAAGSTTPAAQAASGGTTNQEGDAAVFTDEQLTTLRQTLGVADDADATTVLAALNEALAEQADTSQSAATRAPEGMVLLDQEAHANLVADAAAGREARNEQLRAEREQLVTAAVNDGRIPPSRREHWTNLLEADPAASQTLAALAKGTVPISEIGHAASQTQSDDDANYASLFPEEA